MQSSLSLNQYTISMQYCRALVSYIANLREDQVFNFVNLATKSPLVDDVRGSKRRAFGILACLHGHSFAASISTNSAKTSQNEGRS